MRMQAPGFVSLVGLMFVTASPIASRADDPADSVPIDVLMDRSPPRPLVRIDPAAVVPFRTDEGELGCFYAEETSTAIREYEEIRKAVVYFRPRRAYGTFSIRNRQREADEWEELQ